MDQWGDISSQFLLPGGSIGPRYVSKLLFSEKSQKFWNFYLVKNHKIANNSATTEAREKISTYLESLKF